MSQSQSPTLPLHPLARVRVWRLARPRWQLVALAITVMILWGWFDVRRRARVSDTDSLAHKTDVTVYTEAGAAMFDGRDPYEVSNPRGWHYLYPPLFAIAIAPLSTLPPTEQALIWYALSCLCVWGSMIETGRLWRGLWRRAEGDPRLLQRMPSWLSAAALLAMAFPVLNCLQRGQVGVLLVYLILLGTRLVLLGTTKNSLMLGGIILALPVAIKLTPILPAAVLCGGLWVGEIGRWLQRKRHAAKLSTANIVRLPAFGQAVPRGAFACLGGLLGLALWLFLVPAATIGPAANARHLRTWIARVVANDDVGQDNDFNARSPRNQSFANGVRRLGNFAAFQLGRGPDDRLVNDLANQDLTMPMETPWANRGILICVGGLLILLAGATLQQSRDPSDALGWFALLGLACAATMVVSPLSWGHHFVMCWPALVALPLRLLSRHQVREAKAMAFSAAALLLAHYITLDYAGRIGVLGIGMMCWCTVGLIVNWRLTKARGMGEADILREQDQAIPTSRAA